MLVDYLRMARMIEWNEKFALLALPRVNLTDSVNDLAACRT